MSITLEKEVEKYFNKGRRKIVNVTPNDDFSLTIKFDNDEVRKYSMLEKLVGVFEILKNKSKFNEVFIDEVGNIAWDIDKSIDSNEVWNNRLDLCTDAVYIESKATRGTVLV